MTKIAQAPPAITQLTLSKLRNIDRIINDRDVSRFSMGLVWVQGQNLGDDSSSSSSLTKKKLLVVVTSQIYIETGLGERCPEGLSEEGGCILPGYYIQRNGVSN